MTDISIHRGDSAQIRSTVIIDGAAADITNAVITFAVSTVPTAGTPVLTKAASPVSAVAGTFSIALGEADTKLLTNPSYFYEVRYVNAAVVLVLFSGVLRVAPSILAPAI